MPWVNQHWKRQNRPEKHPIVSSESHHGENFGLVGKNGCTCFNVDGSWSISLLIRIEEPKTRRRPILHRNARSLARTTATR